MARKTGVADKPVVPGGRYQAEVCGLGHAGEGIARVDNFAVFVPGALPGDVVTFVVEQVKPRFARGRLIRIDEPSDRRIQPYCSVHGSCGGCQLQSLDYHSQLAWKQRRVVDELRRIGHLEQVPVAQITGMEYPFHYRNKSQYPVARVGRRVVMGFYRRGTHEVVEAPDGCMVDHVLNTKTAGVIRQLFNQLQVSVYEEDTGIGLFRHVVLRTSVSREQVMVVFVTNGERIPKLQLLLDGLQAAVPEVVSVHQNVNTEKTNVIFGPATHLLWGQPVLEDSIGSLVFQISPRSFFQVNPTQTEVLYAKALEAARLSGKETVVDAYCGIGTIALYAAASAARVVGIEEVAEAVSDACRNAARNGVGNAEFHAGRVELVLPRLVDQGLRPDVVIFDPPRRGVELEALQAVAKAEVPRLVYVSCNPSSLARDLGRLREMGYETELVQPVDMFPHTAHIECVAAVKRIPG